MGLGDNIIPTVLYSTWTMYIILLGTLCNLLMINSSEQIYIGKHFFKVFFKSVVQACSKEGEVMLVPNKEEGRVEVCLEGHWGTLCGWRWTEQEARVVCKQLGFDC